MRAQLGGSSRQSLVAARNALAAAVKGVDASQRASNIQVGRRTLNDDGTVDTSDPINLDSNGQQVS